MRRRTLQSDGTDIVANNAAGGNVRIHSSSATISPNTPGSDSTLDPTVTRRAQASRITLYRLLSFISALGFVVAKPIVSQRVSSGNVAVYLEMGCGLFAVILYVAGWWESNPPFFSWFFATDWDPCIAKISELFAGSVPAKGWLNFFRDWTGVILSIIAIPMWAFYVFTLMSAHLTTELRWYFITYTLIILGLFLKSAYWARTRDDRRTRIEYFAQEAIVFLLIVIMAAFSFPLLEPTSKRRPS